MKTLKTLALIGSVSILAGFQSLATPLGLESSPYYPSFPDFGVISLEVSYVANGGTGNFQAQGITASYSLDTLGDQPAQFVPDYSDVSFDLTATISTGGHLSGGTLTILGSMDGGNTFGTLLTGDLIPGTDGDVTTFGSQTYTSSNEGGDYFEFLFTVDSANSDPNVVNDFGGSGAQGGIVLSPNFGSKDPYFQDWGTSFSNSSGNGNADVFPYPVPEPSSILFVLIGSILFVGGYRCRRSASVV